MSVMSKMGRRAGRLRQANLGLTPSSQCSSTMGCYEPLPGPATPSGWSLGRGRKSDASSRNRQRPRPAHSGPSLRLTRSVRNGWKADAYELRTLPVFRSALIVLVATIASAANARPDGNPVFAFECSVGRSHVTVQTENRRLVYRFGARHRTQQTVVEAPDRSNVFYRYQLWPHANMQQLRFQTGRTGYVIYNRFRTPDYSGRGSLDQSGVVVLEGGRVRAHYRCRSGGNFTEDHQLDRLPPDHLDLPIFSSDERR